MIQSLDIWAHANRWHDRVIENWVFAGGSLLLAMLLPPFPGALLVFAISVSAAVFGAGVPMRVVANAMAAPCVFLALGVLPMLLAIRHTPDTALAIAFSRAGLATASATSLRSLGAISALIFLGVTTPVSSQLGMLRRLHAPDILLDIMLLTYRLLFLFDSILDRMIIAQAGRMGYRNLRTGFRSGSLAVASLFVQTLVRAQSMERGLAARGYDGNFHVLDISRRPHAHRLVVIILVQVLVLVVCQVWKWVSHG